MRRPNFYQRERGASNITQWMPNLEDLLTSSYVGLGLGLGLNNKRRTMPVKVLAADVSRLRDVSRTQCVPSLLHQNCVIQTTWGALKLKTFGPTSIGAACSFIEIESD